MKRHSLKKMKINEKIEEIQEHEHILHYILHAWVVNASAIYHFLCCVNLISKMLLSTTVMFVVIFRGNTVSNLRKAVSGSPRQ